MRNLLRRLTYLAAVAALVPACGGGGGGSGGGPPAPVPGAVQLGALIVAILEGDASVSLSVSRTGGVGVVTVQYATADGTATAGDDYTATSGTLTWASGDFAAKDIVVPIADIDGLVEGEEFFTVALSGPTNATIGAIASSTVTIGDGDSPAEGVFQFSALTYRVTEGEGSDVDVTITVRRTGGTLGDVTVQCNVAAGTATAGSDYTVPAPNPVILNFAEGEDERTFTITIIDDDPLAADAGIETINLTLQSPDTVPPSGAGPEVSINQGAAVVEIVDRDQFGELDFSAPTYQVFENGVNVTITVSRLNGASGAVSVDVALGGGTSTAVAGTDYVDPGTITLDWVDGEAADKTFTITLIDNLLVDGNRLLEMTLTNETGGATLAGTNNPAILTIVDDDPGILVFSASSYSVSEGDSGTTLFAITVNRVGGSVGPATVEVTATGGTANNPLDYTMPATPVLLSWASGNAAPQSFNINVVGEATFEPDETILLALGNATGATIGVPSTATATILNDDQPPGGTITLEMGSYSVAENVGTLPVKVIRSGLTALAVNVTFRTFNGTAKGNGAKKDFNAVNTTVSFLATETEKTVNITIVDNATAEPTEAFTVRLSNPTNQSVLGTPSAATVTINDND